MSQLPTQEPSIIDQLAGQLPPAPSALDQLAAQLPPAQPQRQAPTAPDPWGMMSDVDPQTAAMVGTPQPPVPVEPMIGPPVATGRFQRMPPPGGGLPPTPPTMEQAALQLFDLGQGPIGPPQAPAQPQEHRPGFMARVGAAAAPVIQELTHRVDTALTGEHQPPPSLAQSIMRPDTTPPPSEVAQRYAELGARNRERVGPIERAAVGGKREQEVMAAMAQDASLLEQTLAGVLTMPTMVADPVAWAVAPLVGPASAPVRALIQRGLKPLKRLLGAGAAGRGVAEGVETALNSSTGVGTFSGLHTLALGPEEGETAAQFAERVGMATEHGAAMGLIVFGLPIGTLRGVRRGLSEAKNNAQMVEQMRAAEPEIIEALRKAPEPELARAREQLKEIEGPELPPKVRAEAERIIDRVYRERRIDAEAARLERQDAAPRSGVPGMRGKPPTPQATRQLTQRQRDLEQRVAPEPPDPANPLADIPQPRLKVQPKPDLTPAERGVERRMVSFIQDQAAADAAYNAIDIPGFDSTQGGKVLGSDLGRGLAPEYQTWEGRFESTPGTIMPAKAYVRDRYKRELARGPEIMAREGRKPRLLATAGGVASGKSSIVTPERIADADLVLDGTMKDTARAIKDITAALEQGWEVRVDAVVRPFELVPSGAVHRAINSGRWGSLAELPQLHIETQESIRQLARHFADNPDVTVKLWLSAGTRDNPVAPRELQLSEIEPGGQFYYDEKAKPWMDDAVDRAYQEAVRSADPGNIRQQRALEALGRDVGEARGRELAGQAGPAGEEGPGRGARAEGAPAGRAAEGQEPAAEAAEAGTRGLTTPEGFASTEGLTRPQLVSMARARGLDTDGSKAVLRKRIEADQRREDRQRQVAPVSQTPIGLAEMRPDGSLAPKPAPVDAGPPPELNAPPQVGRSMTLRTAGGRSFSARYAIFDARDLQASHLPNDGFKPNPWGDANERAYHDPSEGAGPRATVREIQENLGERLDLHLTDTPTPTDGPPMVATGEHGLPVVLGGNARTMGIQRAYASGSAGAGAYREALQENLERFGFEAGELPEQPVLVRLLDEGGKRGELSRLLNESMTTGRTQMADATSRANRLTDGALERIAAEIDLEGTIRSALDQPARARRIVRLFTETGAFSEADLQRLVTPEGLPNSTGRQVIEETMLAVAVPNLRALASVPGQVRVALTKAAPALVQLRRAADSEHARGFNLDQPIADAIEAYRQWKQSNFSDFTHFVRGEQLSLLGQESWRYPEALALAAMFERDGPVRIAQRIRAFAEMADDASSGQLGLMSGGAPPSATEAFWTAFENPLAGPALGGAMGQTTLYSNPLPQLVGEVIKGAGKLEELLNRAGTATGRGVARGAAALDRATGEHAQRLANWLAGTTPAQWAKMKLQEQLLPLSVWSTEAARITREAKIMSAYGRAGGLEYGQLLAGTRRRGKMLGFEVPRDLATVENRRKLFEVITGQAQPDVLPEQLRPLAESAGKVIERLGEEAVEVGLLRRETFERNRRRYLPRLYAPRELDKLGLRGVAGMPSRMGIGGERFKFRASDAYWIEGPGGRPVKGPDDSPRFESAQVRDEHLQRIIDAEFMRMVNAGQRPATVTIPKSQGATRTAPAQRVPVSRPITEADLFGPGWHALPEPQQAALAGIRAQIAKKYTAHDPLPIEALRAKGVIEEPGYPVAKAIIQLTHDIAMRRAFNKIDQRPDWVADQDTHGFKRVPSEPRYGPLAGKWVAGPLHQEIVGMAKAPNVAWELYDTAMRKWKAGKTVLNPATHGRNVMGNFIFADFAGVSPMNPANVPYYVDAVKLLAGKLGPGQLQEAKRLGVIGSDFVTAELRTMLDTVEIDPEVVARRPVDWVWSLATLRPVRKGAGQLYRVEDEVFKVASWLKQQRAHSQSPKQAAEHARRWFPYYDQVPRTMLMTGIRRGPKPFVSFYYEALRIGWHAMREQPATMLKWLAVPQLITALSFYTLGLTLDDLDSVTEDMRGKVAGWPVFSALLPFRDEQGQLQQWDMTNVVPYADLLGKRIDRGDRDADWWTRSAQQLLLQNPFTNIGVGLAMQQDPYFGRSLVHTGMTWMERQQEAGEFVGKTLLPPLTPGIGTGWRVFDTSRVPRGTLQKRSVTQARLRSLAGVDVRFAGPDLYRVIDEFLIENNVPERPTMGDSTPRSRARTRLYQAILDQKPEAMAEAIIDLEDLGLPARTVPRVLRVIDARHPLSRIPQDLRGRFRYQLTDEEDRMVRSVLDEYQAVRRRAPALFAEAIQIVRERRPEPPQPPAPGR